MAELHPALRPYSIGELVAIPWMTKDGERRSTHCKVVKFAVLDDGDQTAFILNLEKRGDDGKPAKSMIRASSIQRRLDADAAERHLPAEPATDKQVTYALGLIDRLGPIGWHNSNPGQMLGQPTETDLRAMGRDAISALITELRLELGYDS